MAGGNDFSDAWLKALLLTQNKEMSQHLTHDQMKVAQEILTHMQSLKCSICELAGHNSAQCWLNGTFYDECRRRGRLDVNYSFRGGIK